MHVYPPEPLWSEKNSFLLRPKREEDLHLQAQDGPCLPPEQGVASLLWREKL